MLPKTINDEQINLFIISTFFVRVETSDFSKLTGLLIVRPKSEFNSLQDVARVSLEIPTHI